jgi:PAS domain S-box-containing protein
MKAHVGRLLPVGFVLALALAGATALFSYRSTLEQMEAAEWVAHTHVVLERLGTLRAGVLKAESARRGFVITQDTAFFERFFAAQGEIHGTVEALHTLVADNPAQQKRLEQFGPLLQRRLEMLEHLTGSSRTGSASPEEQATWSLAGAELTNRITAEIGEMESAEQDLLRQRNAATKESSRRTLLMQAAGTLVSLALLLVVFAVLRREVMERTRLEDQLGRFFDLSMDALCIAGTDGYFKRVNPAWTRVLGYSFEELTSRPYLEFIHPDDIASTRSAERTVAAGGIESFDNRYRTKDGRYRWLNWNSQPDPRGKLIYAAARDVTESRAAGERLQVLNAELEARARALDEANRELEAFTYSISHDLRAPLRHIDGFGRILLEEHSAQLDSEAQRCLEVVRQATRRMGEMVDDLLNLSRTARQPLSIQVTRLNPMVEEVVAELDGARQGRRIEFRVGALPTVVCDPGLVKQVFANLISNAVKYTRGREVAVIEVGQQADRDQNAVYVRDNGVGFEMKYADKLFGVFQRLHRSEDFEGTGVGLATVQRIVHRHGGRIWAEAKLDEGATFYFTLGEGGGSTRGGAQESTGSGSKEDINAAG